MEADAVLEWARVIVLFCCLSLAAKSDYSTLMVRDSHWLNWTTPSVLLLIIGLAVIETDPLNYCMAGALLATASLSIFDPPDLRKTTHWSREQIALAAVYSIGLVGLLGGAMTHADTDFIALVLGDESPDTSLWWALLGAIVTMLFFIIAWRVRIIQGGADAKALVLVTLVLPSWSFLPEPIFPSEGAIFSIPPSMAMFLWAGAAFLLVPPALFIQNATRGNISSFADLKMAWHSTRRPISDIQSDTSWLLTDVIENEGEKKVINRILPSRGPRSGKDAAAVLENLDSLGVQTAWVANKHPFLVYLFASIIPLVLFGDPVGIISSEI